MNTLLKHEIAKNILLLQGPVGFFFSDLRNYLMQNGAQKVVKVNYNAGDDFFYSHPNIIKYCQPLHQLTDFYHQILDQNLIDAVYLFGDCRFIHQIAIDIFKQKNIPYYVFEEGYIRPNYTTIEQGGVNGYSALKIGSIAKLSCNFEQSSDKHIPKKTSGHGGFWKMALWGFIYFSLCRLGQYKYPAYIHHKSVSPLEILYWIRSYIRKYIYRLGDIFTQKKLLSRYRKKYFFVPLQVYNDNQIMHHSSFNDVTDFINTVLVSFASYADHQHYIVFKHHPLDRGHRNYKKFIKTKCKALGIEKRVFYVHEVSLPRMLRHAKGVITINSTVGLSALFHDAPVKILGRAFYDISGLTYHGTLNHFWCNPGKVNKENYNKYRKYIIEKSQILGSFYSKIL